MTFPEVEHPLHAAGVHRNHEQLRAAIRSTLTLDTRSSVRVIMALEALNAFEEGLREPFKRCPSTYEDGHSGIDCDLREGHPGLHRWDAGDVLEWGNSE